MPAEEGAIVLGKINDSKDNNFGYNALSGNYEDLVKTGVLDPTKAAQSHGATGGCTRRMRLWRRNLESLSDVGLPARQPYISSLTSSVWCVRLMNIGMALDRLVR